MLLRYCFILYLHLVVVFASVIKEPLANIQGFTTDGVSIIGGEDADIKEVPYQVSLHSGNLFICGGSIIAPNIILTAAHCCHGSTDKPKKFQVRAGSTLIDKDGSLVSVIKILPHPEFNYSSADNDVALMWLSEKLEYGETIKAVELAKSGEELKPGTDVLVSGWGEQNFLRQTWPGDILQKLTIPTIDTDKCKKLYEEYNGPVKVFKVTDTMMCAGLEGKNACYGDSGGPLVHSAVQYGIASWGAFCANRKYPIVYTKVAAIRDWIDNAIKEDN